MKKNLLLLLFIFGLCSIHASNPSIITGTWDRGIKKKDTEVKLYRILSGRIDEIASCKILDGARFNFAFDSKGDGFYVIGSGSPTSAQEKYVFYFKPGDRLDVAVNDTNYVLVGKNTPENVALTKWHDYVSLLEYKSVYGTFPTGYANGYPSTYVDFFPLLTEYAEKAKSYRSNTGNQAFERMFKKFRTFDLLRYAYTFIMTPRTALPEKEDYPDFYKDFSLSQITSTTDLLLYPYGVQILQVGVNMQTTLSDANNASDLKKLSLAEQQKIVEDSKKKIFSEIKNDTLKGEFAINLAGRLKSYSEYQKFKDDYSKYILTLDQEKRLNELVAKIAQKDEGLKTIDFSGTDIDGKKVSLSSFKGKVVVVDVWATWCGPCRREIPALKAMEKEYHGKDVVFLSISVDDAASRQKWIDFIKKEELTGVQLFGGNGLKSEVAQFYQIQEIPRFMVFGKNGAIVTDKAPRPSDLALKTIVDEQLKK